MLEEKRVTLREGGGFSDNGDEVDTGFMISMSKGFNLGRGISTIKYTEAEVYARVTCGTK